MRWICEAVGCRAAVLPGTLFCDRHARMIPDDVKRLLEKQLVHSHRKSKKLEGVLAIARQEVLFYQTHGVAMPREQNFQW